MSLTKFGKKLLCFLAFFAFVFAIVSCTPTKTEADKAKEEAIAAVEEAATKILWDQSAMIDITNDLVLHTKVNEVKVEWASTHPDIITTKGQVILPGGNHEDATLIDETDESKGKHVAVTLTATFSKEYSYLENGEEVKNVVRFVKDYKFTVLCFTGPKGSIAEMKAQAWQYIYEEMGVEKSISVSNSNVVYQVGVTGVVTAKLNADGSGQFMIHDGTEGIYVYNAADVNVGDVVSVTGNIYSYYGNLQIGSSIKVTVLEGNEIAKPAYKETTVQEWEDSVKDLQKIGYHGGELLAITAKLEKASEANVAKDWYKLVDPYTAEVAWIYYKSYSAEMQATLDEYAGKYVRITGVTYDRDSRLVKNHLLWDGGIEEVAAPELSDEQKLAQVKAQVNAIAGAYVGGVKLALPTENAEYAATIAWELPADAPYANGKFNLVAEEVKFVAKATITVGAATEVVEVEITVKPIETVSVSQVAKLEKGSVVKLAGTVEAVFASKGYFYLRDVTGTILVYVQTSNGIEVNGQTITLKAGDKLTLTGETNVFNGCPQIGAIISYDAHTAGEWKQADATETTVADILGYKVENAPYGEYLYAKGVIVADAQGKYFYLAESTAEGAGKISLYNSSLPEEVKALAGTDTEVTLFFYFYGFQKTDYSGDTRVVYVGREGEHTFGEVTPPVIEDGKITIAEAIEIAMKQEHNTYTAEKYTVTGTINDLYNTVYGNMHLLDAEGNDLTIYGLYIEGKKYGDYEGTKPVEGEVITVNGILGTYNGKPQMKNADLVIESAEEHEHVACPICGLCTDPKCDGAASVKCEGHGTDELPTEGVVTLEQAVAIANKQAHNTYTTGKFTVTGKVYDLYNTQYGNMHLIDDAGNDLTIYGLYIEGSKYGDYAGTKPVEGDTITVTGVLGTYNGKPQMKNADLVIGGSETPKHEHVSCPTCGLCTDPECDGAESEKCAGHSSTPSEGVVVKTTIADYAAANGWENSVVYETLVMDSKVTVSMTCKGGSGTYAANTGKYYTNGNNWRAYQSDQEATISISVAEGYQIVYVKVTYASNNGGVLVYNGVQYASEAVVAVGASSVAFSIGNTGSATNGQARVSAIEVSYAPAGSTPELPKHEHVACPTCGLCTAADCDGAESEKCAGHEVAPELPTEGVVTLEQAVAIANKQAHNTYTTGKFTVTGKVYDLYNTQYGNMHLIDDAGNDLTIYGLYIEGSKYGDYAGTKPVEGDTITVTGVLGTYNGKPQMKNADLVIGGGETPKHEHVKCPTCGLCTAADCDGAESEKCAGHEATPELPTEGVVTLAQAVQIANSYAHNTYSTGKFTVTGTVNDLYNTVYGNMHLIDAEGNDLTIYGLYIEGSKYGDYAGTKPVEGDVITVTGILGTYNGKPQMKNADLVIEGGSETPKHEHVKCPTCGLCTAADCDGAESEKCAGHQAANATTVVFEFGDNGAAGHVDGSDLGTAKSYTQDSYTLELTGMSKVYGPAKDAQGNSCIKLGTSSKTGALSFTVPENVNEVVIKVAKYKANTSKISVNGVAYTLNNASNDGAYDEIRIDTTTTKTVTFETVSGGVRCMINSIAWVVTEE